MATTKTYDAKDVSIIISDRAASGFNSVSVTRESDTWSDDVGADGEVARSKSNDKRGNFELTMQQTSEFNDFLSSLHNEDEATGNKIFNVTVKDNRGKSLHESAEAWIQKLPDSEYAQASGERVWSIRAAAVSGTIGGN